MSALTAFDIPSRAREVRASDQPLTHGFVSGFMYVVTLCAQLRVELHVFSRATTTRRMTTPGVVLGLHPETMRSVREDFFLHVPNDSRETTHGRAFSYRAFVPKGRRVVLARSLVGGRSFTRSKARGRTRASTGRCARPVRYRSTASR